MSAPDRIWIGPHGIEARLLELYEKQKDEDQP